MSDDKEYQYELGLDGENSEVMDYLTEDSWRFGLDEIGQVHSLGYFLPLLRELFNVNDARTKVVYTILHGLMLDERVRWSRGEMDEKFHWIKPGQRGYLFQRLSNVGWFEYYRDQGVYMISDKGEALMRILSRFTMGKELVENEGAALAEIEFSMMLEYDDLSDRLRYLQNRLTKHNIRAENALKSDSAYRVLEVFQQLQSAYCWAEQTRHTLEQIDGGDDDKELWSSIRSVHGNLSQLHSQISEMQLVLQSIQKKQINISRYGLTHLDIDKFLIHSSSDKLAELMSRYLNKIPHPFFMIEDFAFAEANDILSREIEETAQLRGWDTDVADVEPDTSDNVATEAVEFTKLLSEAPKEWASITAVTDTPVWEVAAYRFSLLTMMADLSALGREAELAADPLINTNVLTEFDSSGEMVEVVVNDDITWTHTNGRFRKKEETTDD